MVFGYTKMKLINNKMKKTRHFYTAIILVSMIAFSSQLTIASPKTISSSFEPCNKRKFPSTNTHFRSRGTGTSVSQRVSYSKALNQAYSNFYKEILIYIEKYPKRNIRNFKYKREVSDNLIREAYEMKLSNTRIICQDTDQKGDLFTTYIVVEMPIKQFTEEMIEYLNTDSKIANTKVKKDYLRLFEKIQHNIYNQKK